MQFSEDSLLEIQNLLKNDLIEVVNYNAPFPRYKIKPKGELLYNNAI